MTIENTKSIELQKKENFVKEFLYRYKNISPGLSSDRGQFYIGNLARHIENTSVEGIYAEILQSYRKSESGDSGRRTKIIIQEMTERYASGDQPLLPEVVDLTIAELLADLNARQA